MSIQNRLKSAIDGLKRTGPVLEEIVRKIKSPTKIVPIRPSVGLVYAAILIPLFYFASCKSARESDYVESSARGGLVGIATKNPVLGALEAAATLAGNASENERAKDSAPVVSQKVNTVSAAPRETMYDAPVNWPYVLMDGRVIDRQDFGNKVVFAFPFKCLVSSSGEYIIQYDLVTVNSDGTNPNRLTRTIWVDETNPQWKDDGSKIEYGVEHFRYPIIYNGKKCNVSKINDKKYCETHQAFFGQKIRKIFDLRTKQTILKNPEQIPFNQGHLTKHR